MNYNRKIMRLELSAEKALNGGYYYAELLLPAADYEIKDAIYTILDGIKNRPMEYDDRIVRQLLECVVVDSKEQITVIFKGGLKSVQPLTE